MEKIGIAVMLQACVQELLKFNLSYPVTLFMVFFQTILAHSLILS
jgi:hypothetical protein